MAQAIRAGMQLTDDLRLVKSLRRGAMGEVWVGQSAAAGQVAVKFLAEGFQNDKTAVQRFEREWAMASDIDSPYVVRMIDHGRTQDGRPYIVMEFLEGETLEDVLELTGAIPARAALVLLRQVASALDAAHARGIVHRDIKPENILLCGEGHARKVKVLDFGLAKPWEGGQSLTMTGVLMGTPYYMSPEQLLNSGKDVDARADVWALGAVTYRLLLGEQPFDADSLHALVFEIIKANYRPVSEMGGAPALAPFFERVFQVDREKRFASAGELVAELGGILGIDRSVDDDATLAMMGMMEAPTEDHAAPTQRHASDAPSSALASTQILEERSDPTLLGDTTIRGAMPAFDEETAPDSTTLVNYAVLPSQQRYAAPAPARPPSPGLAATVLEPPAARGLEPPAAPTRPLASAPPMASTPPVASSPQLPQAPTPPPLTYLSAPPQPAAIIPTAPARPGGAAWAILGVVGALAAGVVLFFVLRGPRNVVANDEGSARPSSARSTPAESVSPTEPQPKQVEPTQVQPTQPQPTQPEPTQPEPTQPEPAPSAAPSSAPSGSSSGTGPALVSVDCKPVCIVIIDGARIGVSPVKDRVLNPGPHKVMGYREDVGARVKEVTVAAGEHLTVEISMNP